MVGIVQEIFRVLGESAPYLLLGFGLAGVLHVVLARFPTLTTLMTGPGKRPVFLAAALGLPMPLCSCGVLPAALALRKDGASKGATSSFLISVPETDIVSIVLTYALLGPVLAIYRPVAALITAVGTGLFVNAVERRTGSEPVAEEAKTEHHCDDHCAPAPPKRHWLQRALHFGFVEMFDDIIARLLLGMAIAGVLMWVLPDAAFGGIGNSVVMYLLMLVIGVPVYVCATASTPVAVGLLAGGVSPGAAMVFLLAGPATNIAGLFVIAREFGRWALGAYLAGIAVFTVGLGVALDQFVQSGAFILPALDGLHVHEHGTPLKVAATVILLLIAAASFYRTRPWARFWARARTRWLLWVGGGHGRVMLTDRNPRRCTPHHDCGGHESDHEHGPGCGHESIEHSDHIDYVVGGHLHHPHGDHCDDHGPLERTPA